MKISCLSIRSIGRFASAWWLTSRFCSWPADLYLRIGAVVWTLGTEADLVAASNRQRIWLYQQSTVHLHVLWPSQTNGERDPNSWWLCSQYCLITVRRGALRWKRRAKRPSKYNKRMYHTSKLAAIEQHQALEPLCKPGHSHHKLTVLLILFITLDS